MLNNLTNHLKELIEQTTNWNDLYGISSLIQDLVYEGEDRINYLEDSPYDFNTIPQIIQATRAAIQHSENIDEIDTACFNLDLLVKATEKKLLELNSNGE